MQRPAPCVNVAPIRLDVEEVGVETHVAKNHAGHRTGRSIGAIHQDPQPAEVGRANQIRQPLGILLSQLLLTRQHVGIRHHRIRTSLGQLLQVGENVGFNLMLQLVGEFVTVGAEDLDAVVLPGIVRGRNDNARREPVGARQVRNPGRGNHAGAHHPHLRRFQSSRENCADQSARLAGVLSDDDARGCVASGKSLPQGASDGVHGSPIQRILARDTPNSIGPK